MIYIRKQTSQEIANITLVQGESLQLFGTQCYTAVSYTHLVFFVEQVVQPVVGNVGVLIQYPIYALVIFEQDGHCLLYTSPRFTRFSVPFSDDPVVILATVPSSLNVTKSFPSLSTAIGYPFSPYSQPKAALCNVRH